jgi:putative polyhydroxyalkanoate system protein
MSHINVHAHHELSKEDAQQAADDLAGDLAEKFDIDYGWDGDEIHFERVGVDGKISVDADFIHVNARLSFLLGFLKDRIEAEVFRYLESHFGCTFDD